MQIANWIPVMEDWHEWEEDAEGLGAADWLHCKLQIANWAPRLIGLRWSGFRLWRLRGFWRLLLRAFVSLLRMGCFPFTGPTLLRRLVGMFTARLQILRSRESRV